MYLFIVLLAILILLSMLGNLLVIFSAAFNKKLRKYTHFLIMNLAASDLLISSFSLSLRLLRLMASHQILYFYYLSSELFCRYTMCLTISLFGVSNFNLLLLTIDRYFAVNHALYYKLVFKRHHMYLLILTSWSTAFAIGMLPIMVKNIRRVDSKTHNDLICTYASVTNQNYTTFVILFTFFVPLFVMIALYMKIVKKVRNTHMAYEFSNSRHPHIRTSLTPAVLKRRERRMSMGILTLLGAHTILLAPISVLDLIQIFGHISIPSLVVEIFLLLTYTNPVVNAPIYAAASKDYYQTFIQLLCCFGFWKRVPRSCNKFTTARERKQPNSAQRIRIHRERSTWYITTTNNRARCR